MKKFSAIVKIDGMMIDEHSLKETLNFWLHLFKNMIPANDLEFLNHIQIFEKT